MKAYVYILIISVFNQNYAQGEKNVAEQEEIILRQKYGPVIFANLLYRHGERTIIESYPNDPHKNSSHWNIGFQQLTKEGQVRHYKLGKWIKARYPDLVGDKYSRENIYVLSSDLDRCIMSAQSNLAGMYPVKSVEPPFQPIPIHTLPASIDNMFRMLAPCEVYKLELESQKEKLKNSRSIKLQSWLHSLYVTLSNYTGKKINDMRAIERIYDTLKIEHEDFNLTLPDWTKPVYPEHLKYLSLEGFLFLTNSHTMKRLRAGPLLTDMVNHLEMKANGTLNPDRKLWVYSGHDTNIVDLLNVLNLRGHNITLPSYATLVALELRKRGKRHFVTVLYKEGNNDTVSMLKINGCDEVCTLERFLELTKNITVNNWKDECTISRNKIIITDNVALGPTEVLFVLLLLLCPAVIFLCCCQPKTHSRYHKLKNEVE